MTTLKGTEKQVAWAEKIRTKWNGFAEMLETIAGREEYNEDIVMTDPLGGTETRRTVKMIKLTKEESKSINGIAANFTGRMTMTVDGDRGKKEKIEKIVKQIKEAVETEESAKFWIELEVK